MENTREKTRGADELVDIPEIARRLPDLPGVRAIGPARIRMLVNEDPNWPAAVYARGRTRIWRWVEVRDYFLHRRTRQGARTDLRRPRREVSDERR